MSGQWLHRSLIVALAIAAGCGGSPTQPAANVADACDPTLWAHVWEPSRLIVMDQCRTVTGTVTDMHGNDDGDFDIRLAVDPQFANMPNAQNAAQLNGHLQLEAICQAPIVTTDGMQACGSFRGNVLLPAVGQHISATGTYVLDTNHGWMELHPLTAIRILNR